MTAGKNQAQPIILKAFLFIGPFGRTALRLEISHELVLRRIESCPSPQSVNGFESGRRNQPWSRAARYSTLRPQAQRCPQGFVHRLFGKIKITQQADQSRQDSSRIHAIKGVEQFAYLLGGTLGHNDDLSKPAAPESRATRKLCPGWTLKDAGPSQISNQSTSSSQIAEGQVSNCAFPTDVEQ